IVLGFDLRNF
ncbi:hypothetical protein HNY73_011622, partial [Argiope bruennichi]